MEVMSLDESLREEFYHRSSFLPNYNLLDLDFVSLISSDIVEYP